MIFEAASIVMGGVAVTGWIFAFRARGEAGRARASALSAVVAQFAAQRSALLSDITATAATAELKESKRAVARLEVNIAGIKLANQELYAKLAIAGIPVGPILVDDAFDRLYQGAHRGPSGADPGSGGQSDRPEVSGVPAAATGTPPKDK